MARLALLCAFAATVAAGLPAPGLYVALGAGLAAIGCGRIAFRRTASPGGTRLAAAAAIAIGALGVVLGAARLALVLAAIGHVERML